MSWALIGENGETLVGRLGEPIEDPAQGVRLSFWDDILGSKATGPGFTFSWGSAEGSAIFQSLGGVSYGYNLRVVGLKVKDVKRVIKELHKALGVKDLTPSFFKLPALPGRLQRLKFLARYVWYGVENTD
ncbi:MAG: hypothetical protein MUP45_02255 [Candidatus Marinimicrobia bacterium]|nr:hypothetical protein [Candidatus Neomarinimicrobiota bacterium]